MFHADQLSWLHVRCAVYRRLKGAAVFFYPKHEVIGSAMDLLPHAALELCLIESVPEHEEKMSSLNFTNVYG